VLTVSGLGLVDGIEVDTCWRVPTSRHPLYDTWFGMCRRCLDPRDARFTRYGGRGIGVCGQWLQFASFRDEIERLLGPRPEGMRLDRDDTDGDYEPGKCPVGHQLRAEEQALTGSDPVCQPPIVSAADSDQPPAGASAAATKAASSSTDQPWWYLARGIGLIVAALAALMTRRRRTPQTG
jgi:hypothetical protein